MQRVLTAAEMREVDRLTVEEVGVPSLLLMENAAAQVVRAIETQFAPLAEQRVVVLCGKGANGGDGLAIARHLHVQGLAGEVEVALVADPLRLSGDCSVNWRMAEGVGVPMTSFCPMAIRFRDRNRLSETNSETLSPKRPAISVRLSPRRT